MFHKYFTSFFYFFFNYFTLSFFCILFLPTTFTHTHDPRHLATLAVLSSYVNNTTGVSQIICVKCQREVLRFSKWKNSGIKCNEGLGNQFAEYHLTRLKRCAKDSPAESGLTERLKKKFRFHCLSRFSLEKNAEVTFTLKRLINRHSKDTASAKTNFKSCFYQRCDKISVKEFMLSTATHCTLRSRKPQLYGDIKSRYLR